MLSLATSGLIDVSFLPFLQWGQTWMLSLIKTTLVASFAPRRLIYDPQLDDFIYASDAFGGSLC